METAVELLFRFVAYAAFGLVMETLSAVDFIDRALGFPVNRRVPKKYLEGFVSVYMIPLHGLGVLFVLEPAQVVAAEWLWPLRFVIYAAIITGAEIAWGFILDKAIGFYPWDYYAESKYRIFKRGYTLWTLLPMWGIAGMILEQYGELMRHLSPYVSAFYLG